MKTLLPCFVPLTAFAVTACGVDLEVEGPARPPAPENPRVTEPLATTTGTLTLEVRNVQTAAGRICFVLFSSAKAANFGKQNIGPGDSTAASCVAARTPSIRATVGTFPTGKYALTVYHDVDGNGTLNTRRIFGIAAPAEPYGFSNDAAVSVRGAPSFADAAFTLSGNSVQQISLKKLF